MKTISIIFIFNLWIFILLGFAQQKPVATEIFKSQQDMEERGRLDEEIWKGERFFIEEIIVIGADSLNSKKLDKAIEGFKNRWLSKSDVDAIQQKITVLYQEAGLNGRIKNIHYDIERKNLKITVEETT